MTTDSALKWLNFFNLIANDPRLNVWHLALLSALVQLAYLQNEPRIIRVSRSRLMALSHIRTLPTYHKYFKELQDFGYVKYIPSYHPGYRSTVEITGF
ncbi:hypothetical protein IQ37_18220 [Chryseobacterium piperi]|uniref:Transcriptional regulator n=1 Tax=Chryseobacterium piperi TaxID=558152 RepID=A0A086AGN1_9FLAO|nr:hypothetical protein [Chryseobacterium piperi]ASW73912.1 hypothetical protein CJF12_06130 [Chryseobacterium piperi]KFF15845.1 hypothetical protein IQ37_18220 [Chryseobacterium piperi]